MKAPSTSLRKEKADEEQQVPRIGPVRRGTRGNAIMEVPQDALQGLRQVSSSSLKIDYGNSKPVVQDLEVQLLRACILEEIDQCWKLAVKDNETEHKTVTLLSPTHKSDDISWAFYQLLLPRFRTTKAVCTVNHDPTMPVAKCGEPKGKDRFYISTTRQGI